ncbi:hypothetical protein PLICRDRAFT_170012 [Plicaturopsis crispa FD-325 SS-3]|nr:hypothetical protein PLICRDRAFT_170012 [Plicaturopsis crispa FD-325 SS-3]
MPASRERSVSGDLDDSEDVDSPIDGSQPPGKPGRKKNPNSQAARRDQNRIAQREFRLRKQQRIRDLEARVEILSGGKDEAIGEMRNILKDLMQENQTLRNLLRGLGSFIGDGAGGLLPKLGWNMTDFNTFVNRSETDTAWESFQQRKKAQGPGSAASKRPAEDEFGAGPSTAKKPRGEEGGSDNREYPLSFSLNSAVPPAPTTLYSSSTRSQDSAMFPELMRPPSGSAMFMQPSPPTNTVGQYSSPGSSSSTGLNSFQSFLPSVSINSESQNSMAPPTYPSTSNGSAPAPQRRMSGSNSLTQEQLEDSDDPKKNEAYKLVHYHLDNYKRNSAYCLPASLRPTLVQRTVPHESVIDRILHPELRDRAILLRGRFDLVDCLLDYRTAVTIHGDDVLAHSNWEIGESWLRKYGFLVDQATLNITNRWRRERGDSELRLADIVPREQASST